MWIASNARIALSVQPPPQQQQPPQQDAIAMIQTWIVHYAPIATFAAERPVVRSSVAARNGHVCTFKRASKLVTTFPSATIANLALTKKLIHESAPLTGLGTASS